MAYSRNIGDPHHRIQSDLYLLLAEYSKYELRDVVWSNDDTVTYPWKQDRFLEKERTIRGDLPSGKSRCRADLALTLPSTGSFPGCRYAFEVKVTPSDVKNWPVQRRDYRSQGYDPVLVVPKTLPVEIAPGHRLVTGSDHIIAHDYDFYWPAAGLPGLGDYFEMTSPIGDIPDWCPECGYRLEYRPDSIRCDACVWHC